MQPADLEDHFAAWHDEDLIRALKIEYRDYEQAYLDSITSELARRKIDPAAFIDQVSVSYNAGEPETCTIDQALTKPGEEFPLWHALALTHYFGSTLVVQRDVHAWLVNVYEDQAYTFSFFIAEHSSLLDLVRSFLSIENWDHFAGERYDLESWQPLLQTRSVRYVQRIAQALADEKVLCTIQTPVFTKDQRGRLALLVPDRTLAATIMNKVEDQILELYAQASEALSANALGRELEIYAKLAEYGLNNPAVFYNLGSALAESGRYPEAATAFIEAASLSLSELDSQVRFQPRNGSGGLSALFGKIGSLITGLGSDETESVDQPRGIPDHVEDIEMQLVRLREQLPQDLQILHGLASIAAIFNNTPRALELYQEILELAPEDEAALSYLAERETG